VGGSRLNNFRYRFFTDDYPDGREATHAEYMLDEKLKAAVRDPDRNRRLFLGFTIIAYSDEFLKQDKKRDKTVAGLSQAFLVNPLQFYAPNTQEQLDFINCDDGDAFAIVDLNRSGKTTAAFVRVLARLPLIPCESSWPIFAEHGVKWKKFTGPKSIGVATYNVERLADPIWREMERKWTPDSELGVYGRTYRGRGRKYMPNWNSNKHIELTCGSIINHFTYEMDQGNYEGGAYHAWLWDEQGRESQFDGADRGTRTTRGIHLFSLTPHKVVGRPDTGAHGWLCPVLTGRRTKGRAIRVFGRCNIMDIPDWYYPESEKKKEIVKWETEPRAMNDKKTLAEGRARLYGEWHYSSDLVLDEWDEKVHWITPPWVHPPDNYTLFRGLDHGGRNPTACASFAVSPSMDIFMYREYFSIGKQIEEDVSGIIKQAGNVRQSVGHYSDPTSGLTVPLWKEVFETEAFHATAMDSRSFSLPEKFTGKNYGWLYQAAGLQHLIKASGKHYEHWVPMVNMLLQNAKKKTEDPEKYAGLPALYIFNTCTNWKRECEGWIYEEGTRGDVETKNPTEKPRDKDNHLMTATGYAVMIPMRYLGNLYKTVVGHTLYRDPNHYWADPEIAKKKMMKRGARSLGYRPM